MTEELFHRIECGDNESKLALAKEIIKQDVVQRVCTTGDALEILKDLINDNNYIGTAYFWIIFKWRDLNDDNLKNGFWKNISNSHKEYPAAVAIAYLYGWGTDADTDKAKEYYELSKGNCSSDVADILNNLFHKK